MFEKTSPYFSNKKRGRTSAPPLKKPFELISWFVRLWFGTSGDSNFCVRIPELGFDCNACDCRKWVRAGIQWASAYPVATSGSQLGVHTLTLSLPTRTATLSGLNLSRSPVGISAQQLCHCRTPPPAPPPYRLDSGDSTNTASFTLNGCLIIPLAARQNILENIQIMLN